MSVEVAFIIYFSYGEKNLSTMRMRARGEKERAPGRSTQLLVYCPKQINYRPKSVYGPYPNKCCIGATIQPSSKQLSKLVLFDHAH